MSDVEEPLKGRLLQPFDQRRVVRLMLDPTTHGGAPVQHIQTHISHVFLAGDYAYKMKKAVTLPFVDFSRSDARRKACEGEIDVNKRTAPDIYLDVATVNLSKGRLRLSGPGTPVDYLVRMRRFPQECVLDRIASEDKLTPALVRGIADRAAELHLSAQRIRPGPLTEDFEQTATDLMARLNAAASSEGVKACIQRLDPLMQTALEKRLPEIHARARHGALRHGHGDLHLRNLCLFNGQVRLFDAIEFEPKFSHIDILYDIAFVVMDLLHRDRQAEAVILLSRYLSATRDYSGIDNLRLFMAVRAGVRALIALLDQTADRSDRAIEYLRLATDILDRPKTAQVIAIGGRSGTGKSTLAQALAPALAAAPDVIVLRADEVRKRMLGAAPESKLPHSAYRAEVTQQVYRRLFQDAARVVRNGATAILDASFLDKENRKSFSALGRRLGVPATGLWLTAPTGVLTGRLDNRKGDASDADASVMLRQSDPGVSDGWCEISTEQPFAAVVRHAIDRLAHPPQPV